MAAYAVTDSLPRPVAQPAARSSMSSRLPRGACRSLDGRRDERSWAAAVGVAVLLDAAFHVTVPKNSFEFPSNSGGTEQPSSTGCLAGAYAIFPKENNPLGPEKREGRLLQPRGWTPGAHQSLPPHQTRTSSPPAVTWASLQSRPLPRSAPEAVRSVCRQGSKQPPRREKGCLLGSLITSGHPVGRDAGAESEELAHTPSAAPPTRVKYPLPEALVGNDGRTVARGSPLGARRPSISAAYAAAFTTRWRFLSKVIIDIYRECNGYLSQRPWFAGKKPKKRGPYTRKKPPKQELHPGLAMTRR